MRHRFGGGIGARIAVAALVTGLVAIGILAVGVIVVGGRRFADLMVKHGTDPAAAQAMFEESVVQVLLVAILVAVIASAVLAAALGPRLARPLRELGAAGRRVAAGDYPARVARRGGEGGGGLGGERGLVLRPQVKGGHDGLVDVGRRRVAGDHLTVARGLA